MGTRKPKPLTDEQFRRANDPYGRWIVGEIIDNTTGQIHSFAAYTDPRAAQRHVDDLARLATCRDLKVYDRHQLTTRLYVPQAAPAQAGA